MLPWTGSTLLMIVTTVSLLLLLLELGLELDEYV